MTNVDATVDRDQTMLAAVKQYFVKANAGDASVLDLFTDDVQIYFRNSASPRAKPLSANWRPACSGRSGRSRIILKTAFGLFPFRGESGIFSGMTRNYRLSPFTPRVNNLRLRLEARRRTTQPLVVDSFAGSVRVEWDHATAFTPLGQLPFFIDFLKTAGLFNSFVADSPLTYESPNASKTRDVLGTAMLSMLAGHKRYSHIAALRGDGSCPSFSA